jgi:asparagine synthetase B (glutamine-hydrolysing)
MSGLAILAGRTAHSVDPDGIREAINPLGLLDIESSSIDDLLLCVGQHAQAPCRRAAYSTHEGFTCLLAGDVVNLDALDWAELRLQLANGAKSPDCLKQLRGSFVIAIVDHDRGLLWAITDPYAWLPAIAYISDAGAVISTSLAALLRALPQPAVVNDDWIYETIYFNHNAGTTSPIAGAERLPPGTITRVDLNSWQVTQDRYHSRPKRLQRLKSGAEAIDEAIEVFNTTVPRYFPADALVTMGVSEGLDCRTVLAATSEHALRRLHSFTFGRPISSEIKEAAEIANQLGLVHTPVLLDEKFLGQLPELARDTVFLSGGLQNVNRSHLLYTYGSLQHEGSPYAVIMTGVSGDHIFRDHIQGWGNVPHIMSADAAAQHRIGRHGVDASFYTSIFGDRFTTFNDRIERALDGLEQEYGEFKDPEAYLSYLMYEAGPRYFGGQAAIANSFSTFRTPFWDPDIIELGYRLQDATIGFSATAGIKDEYRETLIQTAVVEANDVVGRLPYKDLPISAYASGNKAVFQAHRLLRKLRSLVRRRSFVYSEDWHLWYQTVMKNELGRLLGEDSRMRAYVSAEFIDRAVADADVHWLGRLITAEHTLRLIESRWQR